MNILEYWQQKVDLSTFSTMKTRAMADYVAKVRSELQLEESTRFAKENALPIHILGAGSDVIFSDQGLRGVLIQPFLSEKKIVSLEEEMYRDGLSELAKGRGVLPRYSTEKNQQFLQLENDLFGQGEPEILLEFGAGLPWGAAVAFSLQHNALGLHWFARIPCTVGGAAYNNIHAGKHFFSDCIVGVRAYNYEEGVFTLYTPSQLQFGYDYSVFHTNADIITSVVVALTQVDEATKEHAQQLFRDWTKEKARVQPAGANSGSVFKNISQDQQTEIGTSMAAAAWYIDQCGLKGRQIGGMHVFPGHANFIINTGTGSQADFIELVRIIRETVFARFGIWLEPEVECWDERGKKIQW